MSSHSGMWKKTVFTYGIILLGSGILSFGLYNIHERTNVTEGGVLGMTLLLQHWFGFSPSVTSPLMDIACYLLAWRFLGNAFARYALAASLAFAGFHALWEQFPPLLPDLSAYPAIAAVAGALFVGLGVGLVVRIGGACGGRRCPGPEHLPCNPLAHRRCYLLTDLTVLALSLSYISVSRILYSLITVTLSSALIGWVQGTGRAPRRTARTGVRRRPKPHNPRGAPYGAPLAFSDERSPIPFLDQCQQLLFELGQVLVGASLVVADGVQQVLPGGLQLAVGGEPPAETGLGGRAHRRPS